MTDSPRQDRSPLSPLASSVVLVGFGLPSIIACILGGVLAVGSAFLTMDLGMAMITGPFFIGGLAGVWGSETLRRKPGFPRVVAGTAAVVGVLSFVGLIYLMSRGSAS